MTTKHHTNLKHAINHDIKDIKRDISSKRAHVEEAASELFHEGKKLANELYEGGIDKVSEKVGAVQDNVKEYSDELLQKIKEKPLASILIAGGIGFLLSALLKK